MKILKIGLLILMFGLFSSLNAKWGDMKTDKQIEAERIAKQKAEQNIEQKNKKSSEQIIEEKNSTKAEQRADARLALNKFKKEDAKINEFFTNSYGYAIFPNVGKVGMSFGGAYGSGVVYKKTKVDGYSSISQLSFGFQLGGQIYSEVIFFKDKVTYDKFKEGNFEIGMHLSGVVITKGVSYTVEYNDGVAIFILPKGGLMYELSVGGQKFTFEDK